MRAPEFWYPDDGKLTRTAFFLAPLGWLYHSVGRLKQNIVKPQSIGIPILCLGNLTAGGTGKTPLCLTLAQSLSREGYRVHFLTRGYGGSIRGIIRVELATHSSADVGDEALLLAQVAPTWVSSDRVAGAEAAKQAGATLIIMDDGFQNPYLQKDFSILAIESHFGFGNGQVIPAGPMREFNSGGLARADAIVLTGTHRRFASGLKSVLEGTNLSVFKSVIEPSEIIPPLPQSDTTPLVAFSGIGRPQKFFDLLAEVSGPLAEAVPFPDHHAFAPRDLEWLTRLSEDHKARLITTSKDFVRLPEDFQSQVHVLPICSLIEAEGDLIGQIKEKLASQGY